MSVCFYRVPNQYMLKDSEQMLLKDPQWNLLSLIDMVATGSSLEVIQDSIPFRKTVCSRTNKCCGVCTRQCTTRCLQDSLHRLYSWRKIVESTPEDQRKDLPLGIQMIVKQKFETAEELSWAVGEIVSAKHNTALKQYMTKREMLHYENPNKVDYGPQPEIDSRTGKRKVNPDNGIIEYRYWPRSGLCPFCLPKNEVDRRYRHGRIADESSSKEDVPWFR